MPVAFDPVWYLDDNSFSPGVTTYDWFVDNPDLTASDSVLMFLIVTDGEELVSATNMTVESSQYNTDGSHEAWFYTLSGSGADFLSDDTITVEVTGSSCYFGAVLGTFPAGEYSALFQDEISNVNPDGVGIEVEFPTNGQAVAGVCFSMMHGSFDLAVTASPSGDIDSTQSKISGDDLVGGALRRVEADAFAYQGSSPGVVTVTEADPAAYRFVHILGAAYRKWWVGVVGWGPDSAGGG